MNLPQPRTAYDKDVQAALQRELEDADRDNLKACKDLLLVNRERIVLASPNGTLYALAVSNAGVLSATAYP